MAAVAPRGSSSWSAAILAGGRARRLGGAIKATLPVGDRSILARQLDALRALGAEPVIVTADPKPFAPYGLAVIPDRETGGALGGLWTALASAATPHVLVLAGDLPFVRADFLAHLLSRRYDADAVVPRDADGWHPLCACYGRHMAGAIGRRLARGDYRVAGALEGWHVLAVEGPELVRFDPDGTLLLNVNTPDDYARACALARGRPGDRST